MSQPAVARGRGPRDWPALALWAPQLLLALPFLLAGAPYVLWVGAVAAAVTGLGRAGLRMCGRLSADGRVCTVSGPILAVLTVSTLLLELGALLVVRLTVAPDPEGTFAGGLGHEALRGAWSALGQPAVVIAGVLGLILWLSRTSHPAGRRMRRVAGPAVGWATRTDGMAQIHSAALSVALPVAVALPFVLPLFLGAGPVALTAGPVATPEYGKLLLLGALSFVVARDSFRFRAVSVRETWRDIRAGAGSLWRWSTARALYRAGRFLGLPLALFGLVAVASGLRHDFGTVVPAALMTVGVTWAVTRRNVELDHGGEAGRAGRAVRMLSAYRIFIGLGVLFIVAAVSLLSTDYVGERGRVWNDPWAFRWDAPCMTTTGPGGPAVPDGQVPCLRSLAADVESERSQVARAIAATADGGLWGRGLRDTAAGAVPAGATDFVLAAVMAAVANGGRAVRPRLISSVTDPATGRTTRVPAAEPEQALTAAASRRLRSALTTGSTGHFPARTSPAEPEGDPASDPGGTPASDPASDPSGKPSSDPASKPGSGPGNGPAGGRVSWAGGVLDTPRGPLGYAVVVEAPDPAHGDPRARQLAGAMGTAIGETG